MKVYQGDRFISVDLDKLTTIARIENIDKKVVFTAFKGFLGIYASTKYTTRLYLVLFV